MPASYGAASVPELIAAMNAANLTAEADTIVLATGTRYTLTEVNNTTNGATGLPVIAPGGDLTILGNRSTIERGTAGTPAFRLFDVAAGAALTLENMTLQGGLAFGAGVSASGGAIYSEGTLRLDQVIVQNNQAVGSGGAHAYYTISRGGDAFVYPASNGSAAFGGGLCIGGGTATLTDVTLSANTAQGGGGGNGFSVRLNSRFESGRFTAPAADGGDGLGGALYARGGTITISDTSITNNSALGGAAGSGSGGRAGKAVGGGLYFEADVQAVIDALTLAQIRRNKASTDPNIHGPYSVV